jgi:hypothetical protein
LIRGSGARSGPARVRTTGAVRAPPPDKDLPIHPVRPRVVDSIRDATSASVSIARAIEKNASSRRARAARVTRLPLGATARDEND